MGRLLLDEERAAGERAVELDPQNASSWFALGWAAWGAKRWETAEDALLRARALLPDASHTHNNLGALYAKRRRFEEALPCFERGLELDPRSIYAYRNAAYCLRRLGRWEEAEELVRRDATTRLHDAEAALRERLSSPALVRQASAFYRLGRLDDAHDALTKALEVADGPDEAAVPLRELASNEVLRGNDERALVLAERLIRESPGDRLALAEASWVGWFANDPELAARAAKALVDENLSSATVAIGAAEAALAAREWAVADQHLRHALELSRNIADCCLHAELGAVHHYLGAAADAEAEFLEAQCADPRCATLLALRTRFGIAMPTQNL